MTPKEIPLCPHLMCLHPVSLIVIPVPLIPIPPYPCPPYPCNHITLKIVVYFQWWGVGILGWRQL
jgi:hypothetical protein